MPNPMTFVVSFVPATKVDGVLSFNIGDLCTAEKHDVVASGLPGLEEQVLGLAKAFGQSCSAYVRPKNERDCKPRNFDAFCRTLEFIEVVKEEV